jgi:hypothetical protein
MALALAGGAVLGTAALSGPALAQREETLSRDFQPLYQAVAEATNTTGNYAGQRPRSPR